MDHTINRPHELSHELTHARIHELLNCLGQPQTKLTPTLRQDIQHSLQELESARQANAELHALADSTHEVSAILNADGKHRSGNPALADLLGYSQEELTGRVIFDFVHPEDIDKARQTFERVISQAGQVFTLTLRALHKDGSWRILEISGMNLINDPAINGIVTHTRDMTALKDSQTAYAMLAATVESLEDAIIGKTVDGIVVSWNKGAEKLYGYTAEEMIGQSIALIVPPNLLDELSNILQTIRDGESIRHLETIRQRKDGTTIDVSLTVSPIKNPHGDIIGASAIGQDITGRKRLESERSELLARERATRAKVEALNSRLSFFLEVSSVLADSVDYHVQLQKLTEMMIPTLADWCAIDVLTEDGTATRRVAGAHRDPDKTPYLMKITPTSIADPTVPKGVYEVLRTAEPVLYSTVSKWVWDPASRPAEQIEYLRQVGLISVIVTPLLAHDHVLGSMSLAIYQTDRHYDQSDLDVAVDLSRRAAMFIENARLYAEARRINQDLEVRVVQRTSQLEAANRELEAFSYSVSHDLRAPLRAIDGFARILLRDYVDRLPEDGQRRLKLVRDNAQQMGTLIDDLLDFSRLNRQPMQKSVVAPMNIVRQVLQDLAADQEGRQLEITIEDLPLCHADPVLLKQVFVNLLSNALKFTRTRSPAQITIGFSRSKAALVYFVRDNGVGFDMRYVDKLFGVFQRLHRTEEFEGTGVGLAIVQRVIHRHGGQVWAESEENRGAAFYFTLEEAHEQLRQ